MLKVEQITLKTNLLFVKEHPVEVQETTAGGIIDPKEVQRQKHMRRFRTATVVHEGEITQEVLQLFSIKGKEPITTFVGKHIMYTADAVEVVDIPIKREEFEGTDIQYNHGELIFVSAQYLVGLVDEEEFVPIKVNLVDSDIDDDVSQSLSDSNSKGIY